MKPIVISLGRARLQYGELLPPQVPGSGEPERTCASPPIATARVDLQAPHQRDPAYEYAYRKASLDTTASAVGVVVAGVGIFFEAALIKAPHMDWTRKNFELALDKADATVVVLGVFTVVAALSIALTGLPPADDAAPPHRAARLDAWGQTSSWASLGASALAVATALTQFFASTPSPEAALLIAVALLTAVLASAVRTWSGQDRLSRTSTLVRRDEWLAELRRLRRSGARPLPRTTGVFAALRLVALLAGMQALVVSAWVLGCRWHSGHWLVQRLGETVAIVIVYGLLAAAIESAFSVNTLLGRVVTWGWNRWLTRCGLMVGRTLNWLLIVSIVLGQRHATVAVFLAVGLLGPLLAAYGFIRYARARPRGPAAFTYHFRAAQCAQRARQAQTELFAGLWRSA